MSGEPDIAFDGAKVAREWVLSQGYPLEMKVAAAFRAAAFSIGQGEYYIDPESEDPRELDLYAEFEDYFDDVTLRVVFLVECKYSRRKPWLVFTSHDASASIRMASRQIGTGSLAFNYLQHASRSFTKETTPLFATNGRPGYAVVQANPKDRNTPASARNDRGDIAYAAAVSLAKAAAVKLATGDGDPNDTIIEFIIPLIVIDGQIFETYLGTDGEVHLDERERAVVRWKRPIRKPTAPLHIHLVTLNGLKSYLDDASTTARSLVTKHDKAAAALQARLAAQIREADRNA